MSEPKRSKSAKPTRQDVAERANVSVAVVSYVVNDGPRPVAAETRARVEKAIEDLGYYPNESARNLRRQSSLTLGLVIPSINNAVYAEIAEGLDSVCSEEGYQLLLLDSHDDVKREKRLVQMLLSKQVDGVVIQPRQAPTSLIRPLQKAGMPVVLIANDLPGAHCIYLDDFQGGKLATQHLLSLGHRNIAIVREASLNDLSRHRFDAYKQTLKEFGIDLDRRLVRETETVSHEAGYSAMHELLSLEAPPSAVFTHNDVLALGAMHAAREAGLVIPDDISIVGYDDIIGAAYAYPPLTTVRIAKHELGRTAGRWVLELIGEDARVPPRTVTLPVELIVRGSTAPPR